MKTEIENRLEKLNHETEEVLNNLRGIEPENLKKNGSGWSIVQVLSHLITSETLSLEYMKKKMQAGKKMNKINIVNRLRIWITCGFLGTSLKWKAPSYIANPDGDFTLEEIDDKWKQLRTAIKDYIIAYPDDLLNRAVYKHPMAGRLSLNQAINSFIYHQRHHVHQINRIRKELKI